MNTASERIPVLVTKAQKQRLTARAKAAGLSTGEFLRRAGEDYSPAEEDALLEGLLVQVAKTTKQAEKAIDAALAFIAASERRLTKLETATQTRKAA